MLQHLEPWDWVIYAVAGFVAVATLVRLMVNRRDSLVGELREKMTKQKSQRSKQSEPAATGPPTMNPSD